MVLVRLLKALFLLLLAGAIFGGAAYVGYDMFVKPQKLAQAEKLAPPPPPPVDPTLPDWEKIQPLFESGKLDDAKAALESFIENNPISSKLDAARDELGKINIRLLLTPYPSPDKQEYVVKSGDVLNKVAMKMKTTTELIARSNNLTRPNLKIGQRLLIGHPDLSVAIDRKTQTLTLLDHGHFVKAYHVAEWRGPAVKRPGHLAGKVTDKLAWSAEGHQVVFGMEDFAGSTRWVSLSIPGYTLYADPPAGSPVQKPPNGLRFTPEEMEELATLLKKGVNVTID